MSEREIFMTLLTQCVDAARCAGAAIMEIYNRNEECEVELKSDRTPLIDADGAAHVAIKEALGASRIPILSEEGREMEYDERRMWEMFWLVDPLDGTQEFINRTGEFTVNIALIYKGEAVCAVIYAPSLGRLNFAGRGMGSYLVRDIEPKCIEPKSIEPNGGGALSFDEIMLKAERLPLVAQKRDLQRVAVTRSHKNQATKSHLDELQRMGHNFEVVEQGSSYKFCMLAEGVVDYYIRTSMTYEWDIAAGVLILCEAGGAVEAVDYKERIAFNKEDLTNPLFKAYSSMSRIK